MHRKAVYIINLAAYHSLCYVSVGRFKVAYLADALFMSP